VAFRANTCAGGVGVQLHKFNNKKYRKSLRATVNRDIMKSNKEPHER